MEPSVLLTLCIVGLLVVGVNGMLVVMLRKNKRGQEIQMFRSAYQRARDPWQSENKDLDELSKLVKELKKDSPENTQDT